jgi:hypothetical protein
VGFEDIAMEFFYEPLSQDVAHIDDLLFIRDTQVDLGIFSSCVAR